MKEKLKDFLAVILALLVIAIWVSYGFDLPKNIITLEVICGLLLIGIISLMHRE